MTNKIVLGELETKHAWAAWVNSDGTEGRGYQMPLEVCWEQATAIRLGASKDVQGTDATLRKHRVFRIDGLWYAPCNVRAPSREDRQKQEKLDEAKAITEKALAAGLSEDDIALLRSI